MCNLSCNGVSLLARQVAGIMLHCAMILATCFATATAEEFRESTEHFNWLIRKTIDKQIAQIVARGVTLGNVQKIVVALPQSLQKKAPSFAVRQVARNVT